MEPEHTPPAGLHDPVVQRLNLDRASWVRAIRGRVPDTRDVAVAHTVAGYANKDGSNAHPGVAHLVADLCSSDKTVRRALGWLVEHGWLSVARKGNRKLGHADVYQLTVPAPVAVELNLWGDEEAQWQERRRGEPRRPDVAVNRDRKKTPFPAANRDRHEIPPSAVNGDLNNAGSTGHAANFYRSSDPVAPVMVDLPPGLTHQDLDHHSDAVRPRLAVARGDDAKPDFDPDDPWVSQDIERCLQDELGHALHSNTKWLIDVLLAAGRSPTLVYNAARKSEVDP